MTTQFEHNKYFTEELKEHSVVLDAITKQLDDISREVCNLQSKYAFAGKNIRCTSYLSKSNGC